jgi:hypothetical protein
MAQRPFWFNRPLLIRANKRLEHDRTSYCSPLSTQLAIVVFFLNYFLFLFYCECVCTFLRWCNRSFFFSPNPFWVMVRDFFFTCYLAIRFPCFPRSRSKKFYENGEIKAILLFLFFSLAVYLLALFYCVEFIHFVNSDFLFPIAPRRKKDLHGQNLCVFDPASISPIERNKKKVGHQRERGKKKGIRFGKLMNFSIRSPGRMVNANCQPIKFPLPRSSM